MKILFIGDSITKGNTGADFVKLISIANPSYVIANYGINGDTFSNIARRLLTALKKDKSYDWIVLQGGYNDILLPYFKNQGKLFRFAYKQQIKKGLKPLDDFIEFEAELKTTIFKVKQVFKGRLLLTTLGCMNEYREFPLNAKRAAYNTIIRKVAQEQAVCLADCGVEFDNYLNNRLQTNYFINFLAVTLTDPVISAFHKGINFLSKKRRLFLTIDGMHLNNGGAKIFKDCITHQLQQSNCPMSQELNFLENVS